MFKAYAFGMDTKREEQLKLDLAGEVKEIPQEMMCYVNYGTEHETCGIGKWILVNKMAARDYGDNQQNYVIQDWLNLKEDTVVDISTTPDGISKDQSTLIEVKCSNMGKTNYKEFPKRYLPQIAGQMMILNMLGIPVEQVDLVNWTPIKTKIWRFEKDKDYERYLIDHLEEYSLALLSKKDLPEKKRRYTKKLKFDLIYGG
jgi:hypothetical protein